MSQTKVQLIKDAVMKNCTNVDTYKDQILTSSKLSGALPAISGNISLTKS